MTKYLESVKEVEAYLRENSQRSKKNGRDDLVEKLDQYASLLAEVADQIIHLEELTSALPPDLGNIHDLPKELLDELSVAKTDEIEDQIVTVINTYGGEASLDQILVGLYRKFKVVQKRRFMQNKLYRMSMVWSVPGRKGVYTLTEPTKDVTPLEEIDALLGMEAEQEPDDSEIPF